MYDNYTTTYSDYYIKLKQIQLRKKQRIEQRKLKRSNLNQKAQFPSDNELRLSRLVNNLDLSISNERFSDLKQKKDVSDSTRLFLAAEFLTKENPNLDSSAFVNQIVKNREDQVSKRKIKIPSFKLPKKEEAPPKKALGEKKEFSRPPETVDYEFYLLTDRSNATDTAITAPAIRLPNIHGVRRAVSTRTTEHPRRKFVARKPERLVTGFSKEISALEKSIAEIDKKLGNLRLKQLT